MTWAVVECHVPIDGGESPDDLGFDRRFAEPSRLTEPDDPLRAVADELRASGATGLDLAALVCTRVHDHFVYEWGVTNVETTAAEAWAGGRGVCQDYAHCMVALCRLCGLPARYVSGHLLGDGGTHAWVEVLVQDREPAPSRRCPFDPTHDRRVGPRYVTVAVGRDYGDVPPTSGTFEGPYPGELRPTSAPRSCASSTCSRSAAGAFRATDRRSAPRGTAAISPPDAAPSRQPNVPCSRTSRAARRNAAERRVEEARAEADAPHAGGGEHLDARPARQREDVDGPRDRRADGADVLDVAQPAARRARRRPPLERLQPRDRVVEVGAAVQVVLGAGREGERERQRGGGLDGGAMRSTAWASG